MVLVAEFPAIPSSAVKIASERRCAILVHSVEYPLTAQWFVFSNKIRGPHKIANVIMASSDCSVRGTVTLPEEECWRVPNPPGADLLLAEKAFPTSDYWGRTGVASCAEEMAGICRDFQ